MPIKLYEWQTHAHPRGESKIPPVEVDPRKLCLEPESLIFERLLAALTWLNGNVNKRGMLKGVRVASICFASSDGENYTARSTEIERLQRQVEELIRALHRKGVAFVTGTGNEYARFQRPGMGWPAIVPETISVGAVFDLDLSRDDFKYYIQTKGHFRYLLAAPAQKQRIKPGQLLPITQRLAWKNPRDRRIHTTVFAPGSLVESVSITGPQGYELLEGTSQAVSVVAATVALLQQASYLHSGKYCSGEKIRHWLSHGANTRRDAGDDGVGDTYLKYPMLDVRGAMNHLLGKVA
ncbi:MAG: hypothetical protein EXS36_02200 [Pedosphaera sp.]|nr:hypothetical protein [Pedosphaera sp.]